ncbi:tyrosine-type recombinase/integrase [Paenibacillus sp. P32E]|uniref:site-specific integrase n=1 Tax=Paenibacillus sp. P32E TaxID=1349434 RepID=UPI000938A36E|nr:tyrosine-type recombinase/integrase [Paenibacillus sp. P32E]OKP91375.1 integrase [Paenibacillus sp. P32E]
MKGHFYKPHCKCPGKQSKKCGCGAKWSFIIDAGIHPQTGKRRQKKKGGFDTKGDAEAAAAIMLVELQQGTFVEEHNTTFKEFSENWYKYYQSTGKVKPGTVRMRRYTIKNLMPYLQYLKMKDINLVTYQNALNELHATGLAHSTLVGIQNTGKLIFKWAMEKSVIKTDPTLYSYIPRTRETVEQLENKDEELSYLEKEELALFLETAKTRGLERDYVIFMILAYTGLRVGELCALKWKNIDFEKHRISINKTIFRDGGAIEEYELTTPKTKSSIRIIEIDEDLIKVMEEHRARQNEVRMKHRNTYHDQDFVIAKMKSYYGYPEYIEFIEARTDRLLKIANLNPNITPHKFRHTHVSLLAELGIGLQEIMDRLGHEDDTVTKKVYWHVTKQKKKEASTKFAEMLRSL